MLIATNFKLQITKVVPLGPRDQLGGGGRQRKRETSGRDRGREKKGGRDAKSCENRRPLGWQVLVVTIGREEKDPTDHTAVVGGDLVAQQWEEK